MFGIQIGLKDYDKSGKIMPWFKSLLIAFLGYIAFTRSLTDFIPQDIFSTARYFDSLELAVVFDQPVIAGNDSFVVFLVETIMQYDFPNVTLSAFNAALAMWVLQAIIGYYASVSGGYTPKSPNIFALVVNLLRKQDKFNASTFNWNKFGLVIFWLSIAGFDTYTDIVYRSHEDPANLFWKAVIVSIFLYNIGSEVLVFLGAGTLINHGYKAIVEFPHVVTNVIEDIIRAKKKVDQIIVTPQGGQQPQQQQQQQQKKRGKRGQQKRGKQNPQQRRNIRIQEMEDMDEMEINVNLDDRRQQR